jgi:hypothetical protein
MMAESGGRAHAMMFATIRAYPCRSRCQADPPAAADWLTRQTVSTSGLNNCTDAVACTLVAQPLLRRPVTTAGWSRATTFGLRLSVNLQHYRHGITRGAAHGTRLAASVPYGSQHRYCADMVAVIGALQFRPRFAVGEYSFRSKRFQARMPQVGTNVRLMTSCSTDWRRSTAASGCP